MTTPQGATTFLNAISNAAGVGLESQRQRFAVKQAGQIQALNQANHDLNVKIFKHQQSRDRSVDPVTLSLIRAQATAEEAAISQQDDTNKINLLQAQANIQKQITDTQRLNIDQFSLLKDAHATFIDSQKELTYEDLETKVAVWRDFATTAMLAGDPIQQQLALTYAQNLLSMGRESLMKQLRIDARDAIDSAAEIAAGKGQGKYTQEEINVAKTERDRILALLPRLDSIMTSQREVKQELQDSESSSDTIKRILDEAGREGGEGREGATKIPGVDNFFPRRPTKPISGFDALNVRSPIRDTFIRK